MLIDTFTRFSYITNFATKKLYYIIELMSKNTSKNTKWVLKPLNEKDTIRFLKGEVNVAHEPNAAETTQYVWNNWRASVKYNLEYLFYINK